MGRIRIITAAVIGVIILVGLCIYGLNRLQVEREQAIFHGRRLAAAPTDIRILEDALRRYKKDHGVFPTTAQGLETLVHKPSTGISPQNWPEGGYLDTLEVPKDPWGNPYIYISPGQHSPDYDLKSLGADGQEGGDGFNGDIESWRLSR
jgi:general secretion pathway protein G